VNLAATSAGLAVLLEAYFILETDGSRFRVM